MPTKSMNKITSFHPDIEFNHIYDEMPYVLAQNK